MSIMVAITNADVAAPWRDRGDPDRQHNLWRDGYPFTSAPEEPRRHGKNADQNARRAFQVLFGKQDRCAVWRVRRSFVRAGLASTGRAVISP